MKKIKAILPVIGVTGLVLFGSSCASKSEVEALKKEVEALKEETQQVKKETEEVKKEAQETKNAAEELSRKIEEHMSDKTLHPGLQQ
ncbi:uncharacterized protein DUF3359 [Hydrogenivirga caldilitoris]|uniref:Uncharacterized protein DUF3359 n=1 Tax=Hydrogenivirga caldilitoris TaxID=246264 RepID=A0A497XVB3_9AQUI|nr:hypothetical protein [Hydrogenivirga caldilitoris]RLJ71092.1 uncharacterized protein DUF3359 [Hydrogenivirga caldilitoris]